MKTFVLASGLAVLLLAADERADAELKKMQGKWVATALRQGSAELSKEDIEKGAAHLVIDGNRFTFSTPKEVQKGKMTLDPAAKTIDLAIETKEGGKRTVLCIYEFAGDTLKFAGDQDKRPKDFDPKTGGAVVVAFRRAK